jgi:outer membrane protein assembly factor BamB
MKLCKLPLCLALLAIVTSISSRADWPQWRGPDRSGHVPPGVPVPATLPGELKTLWKNKIGEGHSSPVVFKDQLVYIDEQGDREVVHLLDARTGRPRWSVPFAEAYRDEFGPGARATPVIDGDRVYVQSCKGEFQCLSLADGKQIWRTNYETDYGAVFFGQLPANAAARRRGHAASPLIDEDRILLQPGGTNGAGIVCFNKYSGEVLWKSQSDEAGYSSPILATLAGVKQAVVYTGDRLIGLDRLTGALLWEAPYRTAAKRHVVTPALVGDSVIVSSHTIGMVCNTISKEGGKLKATETWANKPLKINTASFVAVDGYLYGLGATRNYVCVDAATGKIAWSQPGFADEPTRAYASTLVLGKNLLILTDQGELVMIAADPEKYREIGRTQACGKTWSLPAYVNGKLYVRDSRDLVCYELLEAAAGR